MTRTARRQKPVIVDFPLTRANIPISLHRLADKIEAGHYGDARICAVVLVQGASKLALFGYGNGSDLEIAGAMARGSVLVGHCLEDIDEPPDQPDQAG